MNTTPLAASRGLVFALALTAAASAQTATDVEQRLAERAAQIEQERNNPGLLADHAADLYFEYLAIEASGWTAILGVPSASQRERARRAGRQMYDHARRAEAAIEHAILDLEATPGYADNLDLQRERRRLVEHERDRRIPFLVGVGASVHAHTGDVTDQEKETLLTSALDVLTPVAPRLDGPLAAHAHLHAGLAAADLGRADRARQLFDQVDASEDAEPLVRFAARLSLATLDGSHAQRNLDRLAAYPDYSRSMFYRLLIADRRFAVKRKTSIGDAVRSYATLLEESLDVPRESARGVILSRIGDAIGDAANAEGLPPFAVLALAERRMLDGVGDMRAQVERLLELTGLSDTERAHALLTLARIHHRGSDQLKAAETYVRLAREHSAQPEAERAIEIGLALAAERYRAEPAAARGTLHAGLALALESYPRLPSIDRWRLVAGRLALNESRYDEALRRFGEINRDHELWIDGQALRLPALLGAAAAIDDPESRRNRLDEVVDSYETLAPRIAAAIEGSTSERAKALRRLQLQLRIQRASALARLDEAERAFELLAGLENEPAADGPLIAEVLQARIEALAALRRTAEAQREIDRFIEQVAPARVKAALGPMLASIERRVKELDAAGRGEQARAVARAELAPLASRLDSWMSGDASRFDPAFAMRIAEAHRHAEQYESALRVYDRVLARQPNAAAPLLGRAECLYHLGVATNNEWELAEAMLLYRRLISAGADMHDVYWLSQLRTLQILDALDRNTHQIMPQIQRLRLRDPGLGGDRFRPEFERLQNTYAIERHSFKCSGGAGLLCPVV